MQKVDVVVVGGGLLGLATARELLLRRPELSLVLLEREKRLAAHQSGHNSGVVHAGLYYAPGSAKARLCREGKELLEGYCADRGIPLERIGKLVVALDREELPRLEELERRARANGVPGLEAIDEAGIRQIEPAAAGIRALWSPGTGVVDYRRVASAYADDVRASGGEVRTGTAVIGLEERANEVVVRTDGGELLAGAVITCAGLWSDRLAAMTGDGGSERIVPFRGDYWILTPDAAPMVRGLIYPVPDPRFPFLGIHLTRRIDGAVWAGPNAVLALARNGYRRTDIDLRELAGVLRHRGFRRLAMRYWRTGLAEQWRDLSKRSFARAVQRYLPGLRPEQLRPGPSGVRAQALDPDGTLVDDFRFGGSRRILHVRNAPSPAATASLAIAREIVGMAEERFFS
ncbi:MAG TPA: L-2-hydroxyglutarate oxidase [Candidatus Limnocylindria bacterium]|nr:L-2-hydroxyglutarate oxidase [Candidatus Limnocylindria bacterium]